jgi:uncharacterized protein
VKHRVSGSWRRSVATLALLGGLGACKTDRQNSPAASPTAASPATVAIAAGDRRVEFRVEVALTPEEHARGLMYRTHLAADTGMIFVFDEPSVQRFWMKNTLIPLDMVFIGADRHVVGVVQNAAPETETERKVDAPSQYVLEIAGGLAAELGIHPGEAVDFRGVPSP